MNRLSSEPGPLVAPQHADTAFVMVHQLRGIPLPTCTVRSGRPPGVWFVSISGGGNTTAHAIDFCLGRLEEITTELGRRLSASQRVDLVPR